MVAALEPGRTSWTAVLDAIRLGPDDDEAEVTAGQVRDVITRVIEAGHWREGDPPILVIFDAGYDPMRLAYQLADLPFPPGSSGYSSVFVGFYPVFLAIQLAVLLWLEILLARSRFIPAMSFVEQPPTIPGTYTVQRFQASLSAFSTVWNYLALVAVVFWLLFYAL